MSKEEKLRKEETARNVGWSMVGDGGAKEEMSERRKGVR